MIIVDTVLRKRQEKGNPIRVGMVGAGFMGRGVALQICNVVPGMELAAISNRSIEGAMRTYNEAGVHDVREVKSVSQLEDAITDGRPAITDDAMLLCEAEGIDAILEVTGAVEFAAKVALKAIENRKHTIVMDAELDGTLGPILKTYADKAGVVFTNIDGDQPGTIMNLYRFVRGIGIRPVLCGNIKGLQDHYRNPTTQEEFARRWKQKPHMVASFADGTKISFEQAVIANATGMRVAQRGMLGPEVPAGTPIDESVNWYPMEEMLKGNGIVDYVIGASPGPGVFVLGLHDHPLHRRYLALYKMGEGPLYCFYIPFHLCHFEVHNTIARAVIFGDAAVTPIGGPCVDVVATAKRNLKAGEVIDGLGGYMTYGQCENSDVAAKERLLPIGLAEGCVLKRDLHRDRVLTYDDVELPKGRISDRLRAEQDARFAVSGKKEEISS